jgi:hypothetical protein
MAEVLLGRESCKLRVYSHSSHPTSAFTLPKQEG